jgi:hypothetical protein
MARPRRGCLAEASRWSSDRGGGDRAVPSVGRIPKQIETACVRRQPAVGTDARMQAAVLQIRDLDQARQTSGGAGRARDQVEVR